MNQLVLDLVTALRGHWPLLAVTAGAVALGLFIAAFVAAPRAVPAWLHDPGADTWPARLRRAVGLVALLCLFVPASDYLPFPGGFIADGQAWFLGWRVMLAGALMVLALLGAVRVYSAKADSPGTWWWLALLLCTVVVAGQLLPWGSWWTRVVRPSGCLGSHAIRAALTVGEAWLPGTRLVVVLILFLAGLHRSAAIPLPPAGARASCPLCLFLLSRQGVAPGGGLTPASPGAERARAGVGLQ